MYCNCMEMKHLHAITVPAMISGYISLYQNIFLSKALNTSCHHMSACTKIAVNYRQLQSRRLLMNACTFIKTFCSCSDTRNWYVHRTSTPSLSLWHTWIYFSYDIACSIDIGIHQNAVFASVQSSIDSFSCEGMRYIVSIDWYLILVNGTSLRLYCFFTDYDSDPCRFSFVYQ